MKTDMKNLGTLTPIHTDFGSSAGDLLVVEYDVPETKVKQTLFYKYGQLSIPKWALIPAGILTFGLLTALCAIIANSILSQPTSSVTYSQTCSKTSKCKTQYGLICGTQSKCVCPDTKYWYEDTCADQPTYREQCNQTTECRTDLGLMCAEVDGQCNCPNTTKVQTCDCSSTSYWTGSTCTARLSYLGTCSVVDTSYQCLSNLYCNGSNCICSPKTQYWNFTANECYSVDKYLDLCDPLTSYSCDASVSLYCLSAGLGAQCPFNVTANSTSCDCASGNYWNGGSCVAKKSINLPCFWNCECNSTVGLQCLNMSCVCPKKNFWSTISSSCESQMNYTQTTCLNNSYCDSTQGLTCYLSGSPCNCPMTSTYQMCDCSTTQYYDYNLTSCQTLRSYNETCYGNYMCDSTLGLFCQLTATAATNCSCPEPVRPNMCDCNMTSYWDGTACVLRLAPNISCSYAYQCQTGYTCIVNETILGIFSDVCRCPLGSYFVNGSNCVPSKNYTNPCEGSYQCYEPALSCRYNDTGLTCLDSSINPLPACDCLDNYYFDAASRTCIPLLNRNSSCTDTCQCIQPYECISGQCECPAFYSSINKTCVDNLAYGDACSSSADCSATPNAFMICESGTCGCNSTGFWDGSKCQFLINFRALCTSNNNCYQGFVCQNIPCIDSNKRCTCPENTYFSSTRQNCTACTGSDGEYDRYVVNYPTSDICIAVLFPTSSRSASLTFSEASSGCASLTALPFGGTPQLISVHNQTELNCIATVLESVDNYKPCSNDRMLYIGLTSANGTFYDGTSYTAAFSTPTLQTSLCLTYCYNNNNIGTLNFMPCTTTWGYDRYGAMCDYRVY